MVIDLGTGSGRVLLRRAAREPQTLFLGIDADASVMAEVSRRAARPSRRGAAANVIIMAAAAEELPGILAGTADSVTIALPWGSLLRTALNPECAEFAAIVATARPGAMIEILVSSTDRDAAAGKLELDSTAAAALAARYGRAGLRVEEVRLATTGDVARLSSGWGRRLGIPDRRTAWLYALRTP